ncbi:hypothetical protein ACFX2B_018927 [Malus domestica]
MWHYDKKGVFSVKKCLQGGTFVLYTNSILGIIVVVNWGCLPRAVANYLESTHSAKVKVCGWRIYCDILPTRSSLNKKDVRVEESCPRCDEAHKTDSHALRDCSFSRAMWAAAPVGFVKCFIIITQLRNGSLVRWRKPKWSLAAGYGAFKEPPLPNW